MFNNYFASQCTPIKNGSKLPNFSYKTEKILTSFDIKDDDILSIIKNLNVYPHGWDQLSMRMIKTCVDENYFSIEVFERLVFNVLFNFFLQNKLFTPASLALYQVIPVFCNYYQLHMKFIKVLIATHPPI